MGMLHIDCEDEREILGICDHSGHVKKMKSMYAGVCWKKKNNPISNRPYPKGR